MHFSEYKSPMTPIAVILALGVAPSLGMAVAGGWGAATAFVAVAAIVVSRALSKHATALRDPELPPSVAAGPQGFAMLAAMRGRSVGASPVDRVEALRALAAQDPERAHAELVALVEAPGRNLAALVACTEVAFSLGRADAPRRWAQTLASALDGGMNRLAASTFARHADHRESLVLEPGYGPRLAAALSANGEPDHGRWVAARAAHWAGNAGRTP